MKVLILILLITLIGYVFRRLSELNRQIEEIYEENI